MPVSQASGGGFICLGLQLRPPGHIRVPRLAWMATDIKVTPPPLPKGKDPKLGSGALPQRGKGGRGEVQRGVSGGPVRGPPRPPLWPERSGRETEAHRQCAQLAEQPSLTSGASAAAVINAVAYAIPQGTTPQSLRDSSPYTGELAKLAAAPPAASPYQRRSPTHA